MICMAKPKSVSPVTNDRGRVFCLWLLGPAIGGGALTLAESDQLGSFRTLAGRADDEVLQGLVGVDVVRLLRSIDPELSTPSKLRELLLSYKTPTELLRDPAARASLLELLPQQTAIRLLNHLGVSFSANPFLALKGLNVRKGSVREARLLGFFGVEAPTDELRLETPVVQSVQGQYQLFEHQRQAVSSLRQILSSTRPRVLLHMPTGAGKTRTAMNVVADHLRMYEPTLVVWLAFSEELCEQAVGEFNQSWKYLGNRSIDVIRFWGNRSAELQEVKDGLVIAGLGKAYNYALQSISSIATLADRTTLVVIDEAHQSLAPTYRLVLDTLVEKQPTTGLLGLTATPGRTWDRIDDDQQLADFFLRQKVGLEVQGYSNPVDYLIEEGYLARPIFKPLFFNSGNALSSRDLEQIEISLDIPNRLLERLARDEQRNLRIVQRTEQLAHSHDRVILFANSVRHARLLAAVLRSRGYESYAVTGDTTASERYRIINKYRSSFDGPIILCNYCCCSA